MWIRAIGQGTGVVNPSVLACYRQFDGNDTGRQSRSAESLIDHERFFSIMKHFYVDYPERKQLRKLLIFAIKREKDYIVAGDKEAALANRQYWTTRTNFIERLFLLFLLFLLVMRDLINRGRHFLI